MEGDVVVLGGGSTGEAFAAALRRLDPDVRIVLVESALVGGECSYYACMPSKTLLRPAEALHATRRAPGAAEAVAGRLDAERVFWWRDQVAGKDDSSQVEFLARKDVELVRGSGRVAERGVVEVDGRRLAYDKLVLATGSSAAIPPIEGLAGSGYWTSREATSTSEVPRSIVVVGGGVVGCELGQLFRRLGSAVTIVQRAERLLPALDPQASGLLQDSFIEEGIELRLAAEVLRVETGFRVHLAGGEAIDAERLLIATGRRPNVEGLEPLGLTITEKGVQVDESLRAAEDVWALGDVNGIAPFTHVGKYQARVAARSVAGQEAHADHRAVPAAIFTDPQVASVGRTRGEGLVTAEYDVGTTARASTYERPKRKGLLKVFVDPERRVLVGAVAVGPEAGEWNQQLTLAVRAEIPIDVLRDTIQPYPTFSEAVFFAVRDLPL